ncbi:MAG: pilus assembly protein MshP [Gammaproteobacteria bacterium]|nr:pilus assembly protein MshP [Gammaproteobacteria bacterium]
MNALHITRARQRGVSLVAAIFLLVVLAGLGVFAVRLGVLQAQTTASGLRAAQAFHAARAGVAWAAHQALNGGGCGAATLNLTEGGTSGFDVAIQCAQSSHVEAGSTVNVYVIDALAEGGAYGGPDYVSRRLQAKITDAS